MSTRERPIRILHVVGSMNTGGVETWLMHVLRRIDRSRYHFDFLTHTTKPCTYDDEIRSLGCRIIPCLHPSRPWQYARRFRRILNEHGPYDVVHSHVHHYSGFVLRLAEKAGVPRRIAHSHNDTLPAEANAGLGRRIYLRVTERLIAKHATHGLACSAKAAQSLFGPNWQECTRWRVLHYGIDLTPFAAGVDRSSVRAEFGIPADAFVVGHVGRFAEQKNHIFLIDILAALVARSPDAYAMLIGDGPLRASIEEKVRRVGIKDRVLFLGVRSDIARLMLGAMDVFLLPSIHEGLPLASLEAQAAGLPVLISDVVSSETDVVQGLISRLPLSEPPENWANRVLGLRRAPRPSQANAVATVFHSAFDITSSSSSLVQTYHSY